MTTTVDPTPFTVLSADDALALDGIAIELAQPDLPFERRSELLETIAAIAEKYTCDPRMTDD